MPKRDDIESVLVIGSGPIVIGQACQRRGEVEDTSEARPGDPTSATEREAA